MPRGLPGARSCRDADAGATMRWGDDGPVRGPHPYTRAPLRDLDLAALLGQRLADVRATIESLGGELRTAHTGLPVRGDLRPNRITVICERDVVTEVVG